jgi:hypothetical protein
MKVSELKPGMLLTTIPKWELVHTEHTAFPSVGDEYRQTGAVPRFTKATLKRDVFMFVERTQDDFMWCGVNRHYKILWDGKGTLLTGYDFRYLQEFTGSNNE